MTMQRRVDLLRLQIAEHRAWMARCGGDLAGYVRRYGSARANPEQLGGEVLYHQDADALRIMEQRLAQLEAIGE